MSKLKCGVAGAGRVAQVYAAAFGASRNAELVAIADVDPTAAAEFAAKYGCKAYASHARMLEAGGFDAVLVCTPPLWHEEISIACMERGYHVLCEKPLAITPAAARRMLSVARSSGAVFAMASKYRYVPDIARAAELTASGVIGEVVALENVFASRAEMRGRWNSDPSISGGGVLIDHGSHSVNILRYFLGELEWCAVLAGTGVQGLPVEETVRLCARSRQGVLADVMLSWSIDTCSESYVRLYGSEGALCVGWRSSAYKRFDAEGWVTFGSGYDRHAAFTRQLENFAAGCRGEEALRVSDADALASVEMIAAAYEAMTLAR